MCKKFSIKNVSEILTTPHQIMQIMTHAGDGKKLKKQNSYFSVSVYAKNGLHQIQIPYLRASHKLDFMCLFLALWLELLSLIATSSAAIRTISFCLDTMTGGLVRIYILGIFLIVLHAYTIKIINEIYIKVEIHQIMKYFPTFSASSWCL